MQLDFSEKIQDLNFMCPECYGSAEEISGEIWAAEKNKGKTLNKPFRTSGGPKKFSVYVKNDKGNVVKVNFGDPNMEIKRDDPKRRKSFRARHNCDNPGPKTKARYWSCRQWRAGKKVQGSELQLTEEEKQDILLDEIDESEAKKGLWENIRDKKKREGKKYRPAKPGDKDYPDPDALKKAQESSKKKKESKAELTKEQKTLPPALQKKILEKKGKSSKEDSKKEKK
ncbi:hypothetical protein OAA62_01100 [bacterium]|nr:hypothetical protein [bacterium]